MRNETRLNRYNNKINNAIKMPLSLVTINFMYDDNLAFLIRAAACFGVENLYVIGDTPPRNILYPKSGSLYDFVNIKRFRNPSEFLKFSREENLFLISAEIEDGAYNIHKYNFDLNRKVAIVLGNEMTGIPVEILMNSIKVFIPMPGVGYCLNTAQAGTIFIHEYSRQFINSMD